MLKLLTCLALVSTLGCHKDPAVDPSSFACGTLVSFRLYDVKAIPIQYAKKLNQYYIITDSDSTQLKTVAVFCDLPEAYRVAGKTINFDGRFSPVNALDTTGLNGQLNHYFSPARVLHVAINKLN